MTPARSGVQLCVLNRKPLWQRRSRIRRVCRRRKGEKGWEGYEERLSKENANKDINDSEKSLSKENRNENQENDSEKSLSKENANGNQEPPTRQPNGNPEAVANQDSDSSEVDKLTVKNDCRNDHERDGEVAAGDSEARSKEERERLIESDSKKESGSHNVNDIEQPQAQSEV